MTDVKTNYKNKHAEYNCVACETKEQYIEETQEHIYYCHEIKQNPGIFGNIFEDTNDTQIIKEITKQFTLNMNERKRLLPE